MDEFEKMSSHFNRMLGAILQEYVLTLWQDAQRKKQPTKKKNEKYYEELRQKYGHKKIS